MVKLRKMSQQEFIKFYKYSIADYANDLMRSGNISSEEAIGQSEKEFMKNQYFTEMKMKNYGQRLNEVILTK